MVTEDGDGPVAAIDHDASASGAPSAEADAADVHREIGRHVVLGVIGSGAMGPVHRAYDPRLRREVAVKLLLAMDDAEAGARAVREAQAMARLSHPNIVAVYDADVHAGRPFIAMEYVEGTSLATWMQTPRPWRDALAVLVAAGRGLAAAHDAGLIHGDFEPAKVIVGVDGRARVTDFGVARRTADPQPQGSSTEDAEGPDAASLSEFETRVGTIVGTPAYMAPELADGVPADVRSDLYAFCVTAWEVLYGARPFSGAVGTMFYAKTAHRLPPVGDRDVPAWVHRELVRGLSPTPSGRPVDMPTLLGSLGREQTRARRWSIAAVAVAAGVTVAGVWGGRELITRHRIAACEEDGDTIDAVWNAGARDALLDAARAQGVVDPQVLVDNAAVWFDDFAARWRTARTQLCIDTKVEPDRDARGRAHVAWCLEDGELALSAVLDELIRTDAAGAYRLVDAAAGLPSPAACGRPTGPAGAAPESAPDRARVREIRTTLARALALGAAGQPTTGLELAETALAQARELGWTPLVATAGRRVCDFQSTLGRATEALATCEQAYFDAAFAGLDDGTADAALALAGVAGDGLGRVEDGRRWARLAEVAIASFSDPDELRRGKLLSARGALALRAGEHDDAREIHEALLELLVRRLGPTHPEVAVTLDNLAVDLTALGDRDGAMALYERASAVAEQTFGANHPNVAWFAANVAGAHADGGDVEAAQRGYDRALGILERAHGPMHADLVAPLVGLAEAALAQGRAEQALASAQRAVAVSESSQPETRWRAAAAFVLARALVATGGDRMRARQLAEVARAIARADPSETDEAAALDAWLGSEADVEAVGVLDRAAE